MKKTSENKHTVKITVPKGKFCGVCPHIDSTKYCKLTGTYQDGYHLQTYCLSQTGEYLSCANYR